MATCLLTAVFVAMDGDPLQNFTVVVENMDVGGVLHGVGVGETKAVYATDATGWVGFRVLQGMRIRVSLRDTGWTREFIVPTAAQANLLSLGGETTDRYAVVR